MPNVSGDRLFIEMRFYLIDQVGNQYGPVDLPTLNQWVAQGRVLPDTQIRIEQTGKVVPASMVPGINLSLAPGAGVPTQAMRDPNVPIGFPGAVQPMQGPYNNYAKPGAFSGGMDVMPGGAQYNLSIGLSIGSLVLCFCAIAPIGVLLSGAAIYVASQARAAGHPGVRVAYILAIVTFVLCLLGTMQTIFAIQLLRGIG